MSVSGPYPTLYNAAPTTSNSTLYTSAAGDGLHQALAINGTGSAATITLTLVRKGGTLTDAYAVPIAAAVSVAANSCLELLYSEGLHSEYGELLMETGDTLQGLQGTGSAITLLVFGT